jgi:hypothetical protein
MGVHGGEGRPSSRQQVIVGKQHHSVHRLLQGGSGQHHVVGLHGHLAARVRGHSHGEDKCTWVLIAQGLEKGCPHAPARPTRKAVHHYKAGKALEAWAEQWRSEELPLDFAGYMPEGSIYERSAVMVAASERKVGTSPTPIGYDTLRAKTSRLPLRDLRDHLQVSNVAHQLRGPRNALWKLQHLDKPFVRYRETRREHAGTPPGHGCSIEETPCH